MVCDIIGLYANADHLTAAHTKSHRVSRESWCVTQPCLLLPEALQQQPLPQLLPASLGRCGASVNLPPGLAALGESGDTGVGKG